MARLMFIRESDPLAGARVELLDTGTVATADEEGRVDIDLESGETYDLEVVHESVTYRREVRVADDSTVTVVDVAADEPAVGGADEHLSTQPRLLDDRFEFVGQLGSGGMGSVVKARDSVLGRNVAIKLLTRDLADYEEAREIFMKEARSLAKLSHPNLVAIHDVIEVDQRPMLVTEYVEGVTLEEAIQKNGALPQSTAFQIGIQVCAAVEYLHDENVIHRDIKPGNIMLGADGTLKLIDFGLARSLQNLADRGTRTRGTPAYMAPEQVRGDERTASLDLYQVGVTLFETLAGRLPFDDGDLAYAHAHESPPRLDDVVPNLLPGAVDLVDACLQKNPSERPASVEVVRRELESLEEMLTSSRIDRGELTDPNLGPYDSDSGTSSPSPISDTRVRDPSEALAEGESGTGDAADTRVYDEGEPPDSEPEPETKVATGGVGDAEEDEGSRSSPLVPAYAKGAAALLLVGGVAYGAATFDGSSSDDGMGTGETADAGTAARATGPENVDANGNPDTRTAAAPNSRTPLARAVADSRRRATLAANAARIAAENQVTRDGPDAKPAAKSSETGASSGTETAADDGARRGEPTAGTGASADPRRGEARGHDEESAGRSGAGDSDEQTEDSEDAGVPDNRSETTGRSDDADAGAGADTRSDETVTQGDVGAEESGASGTGSTSAEAGTADDREEGSTGSGSIDSAESETTPPSKTSEAPDDEEPDGQSSTDDEADDTTDGPSETDDEESEEKESPSVPRTF